MQHVPLGFFFRERTLMSVTTPSLLTTPQALSLLERGGSADLPSLLCLGLAPGLLARKRVAGKIGEFVEDHRGRLVPAPFPLATLAEAWIVPGCPGVSVEPPQYWKTRALCTAVLRAYGAERIGIHVRVTSALDSGKGCAVSTASMRAAAYATAECIGALLDPAWLARTMATIEPCDANASDGRVLVWDFKHGHALSPEWTLPYGVYLGAYPVEGTLDTGLVDTMRPDYTTAERCTLTRLFDEIPDVLRSQDLTTLAQFATLSAKIDQHYFPKPEFSVLQTLRRCGVLLGFWVAHSGVAFGGLAAPGSLAASFSAFAEALGPGYRLFAFEHDRETAGLPFLIGCGGRLLSMMT